MIFGLSKASRQKKDVLALYAAVSVASRQPGLYLSLNIPDTVEGRFESLGLHLSLVLRRLKQLPAPALDISKDLIDHFFQDLDGSLRQLGVGDLSVGKKIKILAQAFYGRAKALEAALSNQPGSDKAEIKEDSLALVLARNVLGISDASETNGVDSSMAKDLAVQDLAVYVRAAEQAFSSRSLADILSARDLFPVLPIPVLPLLKAE